MQTACVVTLTISSNSLRILGHAHISKGTHRCCCYICQTAVLHSTRHGMYKKQTIAVTHEGGSCTGCGSTMWFKINPIHQHITSKRHWQHDQLGIVDLLSTANANAGRRADAPCRTPAPAHISTKKKRWCLYYGSATASVEHSVSRLALLWHTICRDRKGLGPATCPVSGCSEPWLGVREPEGSTPPGFTRQPQSNNSRAAAEQSSNHG